MKSKTANEMRVRGGEEPQRTGNHCMQFEDSGKASIEKIPTRCEAVSYLRTRVPEVEILMKREGVENCFCLHERNLARVFLSV
jgi:hypothetical protein